MPRKTDKIEEYWSVAGPNESALSAGDSNSGDAMDSVCGQDAVGQETASEPPFPKPDRSSSKEDIKEGFPVVGVGASAGGLEALEKFFKAMPVDSGMAYVVVQHLSPDFKSVMDELLGRQ